MKKIKIEPQSILLEPARRNTAPAITIAALKAIKDFKNKKKDPILLILSSDHHIDKIEEFKKSIQKSIELAKDGNLIIFGVVPTFPSTGYGYIEGAENLQINKYI